MPQRLFIIGGSTRLLAGNGRYLDRLTHGATRRAPIKIDANHRIDPPPVLDRFNCRAVKMRIADKEKGCQRDARLRVLDRAS